MAVRKAFLEPKLGWRSSHIIIGTPSFSGPERPHQTSTLMGRPEGFTMMTLQSRGIQIVTSEYQQPCF